jgi:hypothetical protein
MTTSISPNTNHGPARNPGNEMLTLAEAGTFLRVPEGTLRYWRHLGAGPHSFKVGRHIRYWRTDLITWLAEQTRASSPAGVATAQPSSLEERRVNRPQGR